MLKLQISRMFTINTDFLKCDKKSVYILFVINALYLGYYSFLSVWNQCEEKINLLRCKAMLYWSLNSTL